MPTWKDQLKFLLNPIGPWTSIKFNIVLKSSANNSILNANRSMKKAA
jgi:hypothetical protein